MSWWPETTQLARQMRLRKPRFTGPYRYVRVRWHVLFGLVDLIGQALRMTWQRWIGQRPSTYERPRSILMIQLDHMGDAVITAAVLPAIRKRYPAARLEMLASPWNREVFEISGVVDAIHVCSVNRFAQGWRPHWLFMQALWGLRLRRRKFDLAVDVRGELPLALIAWLAGAKRRVGWNCGGGGFLLTDSADYLPGRPEMESRLALLKLIDVAPPIEVLQRGPWLIPPAAARASIADRLDAAGENRPFVVMHLGAGTAAKRWPAGHWRELIGCLIIEMAPCIVLIGGKQEQALAADVLQRRKWPGVEDWTGRLTLGETAAAIEQADLFIGADSGPAHLAAAVGTPAVVLFSGTNRVRQWRPWGQVSVVKQQVACSPCHLRRCPLACHPCMDGILPKMVAKRVIAALEGSGKGRRKKEEGGIEPNSVGTSEQRIMNV